MPFRAISISRSERFRVLYSRSMTYSSEPPLLKTLIEYAFHWSLKYSHPSVPHNPTGSSSAFSSSVTLAMSAVRSRLQ